MNIRAGFFDLTAQLRRAWIAVAGMAVVGLVAGVAVEQTIAGNVPGGIPKVASLGVLLGLTLIGFALGLAVGFVLVRLQPRVTTADDVRRVTGLPVLAQLPAGVIDADDLEVRAASRRMRSALREAVMNTRSLAGGELPARLVLARTEDADESAGVDGGLARALVESGFVSAVVRTDLETQLLARPSTVDDSALEDPARADASGYQRVSVPDRVASARPERRLVEAESFFTTLSERYDAVVALAGSNTMPVPLRGLAPVADAVVVVVRSNRTTVEDLLALHGELLGLGVEPLGVLMTGVAGRHRSALRREWVPSDFRLGRPAQPSPEPISVVAPFAAFGAVSGAVSAAADSADDFLPSRSGFSIADLAARAEEAAQTSTPSGRDSQ
ncbi:hypothetical protein EDF46_0290 [Frondihabitans sp. PhB188]|uniref:hypothetical protein n=1 Tax=Frondihabitans sp. PhB188 TaxID=2485200 RepID=UPI000F49C309|nr:hypothetical protein [Frondihabitans sp. PhB188]ROQ40924.1 hypothetical protein EDF46_0290 [Frondihabitans sp. PhB188]